VLFLANEGEVTGNPPHDYRRHRKAMHTRSHDSSAAGV